MKIQIHRTFFLLLRCRRKPRLLVLLAAALLLFLSLQPSAFSADMADKWQGVDESVVEKYAKEHGREARTPFINTDQGDLLLFVFLLAGAIGGFAAGYYWRSLTENKIKKSAAAVLLALCVLLYTVIAAAEDAPNFKEDTLTGDWGGSRTKMSEKGMNWEIVYKADLLANVSGGLSRSSRYMDNLDIKLEIDGEKAFGWTGGSALFYLLGNQGGKLNAENVGSFMGVDNIETNANTIKLYQALLGQRLLGDKLSIVAGLYDFNSEFYVTDSSALFLHPAYGIGTDMSQTGLNGPSIFPTTSLALRLKWEPDFFGKGVSLQAVLLDGVPGNTNNPYGTHIRFDSGDGALLAAEFSLRPAISGFGIKKQLNPRGTGEHGEKAEKPEKYEPTSKYSIGFWRYTSKSDDLLAVGTDGNPLQQTNQGIYALLEQSLFHEKDDPAQGLTMFIRGGVTRNSVNIADRFISAGLNYKGLLPGRDDDQFGIAFAKAYAGNKHKQAMSDAATPCENYEAALELTYRAQITPWLAIQPDIQFIMNPGFDPNIKNSLVAGSRVEISF